MILQNEYLIFNYTNNMFLFVISCFLIILFCYISVKDLLSLQLQHLITSHLQHPSGKKIKPASSFNVDAPVCYPSSHLAVCVFFNTKFIIDKAV